MQNLKTEFEREEFMNKMFKDVEKVVKTRETQYIEVGYDNNVWLDYGGILGDETTSCGLCDGELRTLTVSLWEGTHSEKIGSYIQCSNNCCSRKIDYGKVVNTIMSYFVFKNDCSLFRESDEISVFVPLDRHWGCASHDINTLVKMYRDWPDWAGTLSIGDVLGEKDIERELKKQKDKNKQLDCEVQRLKEESRKLKTELGSTTRELNVALSDNAFHEAQIGSLRDEVSALQKENNLMSLTHNCEDVKKIKKLQNELCESQKEIKRLKRLHDVGYFYSIR